MDDGSPDRCGAMCDEWAKKDSRIRVIHKKNGGLSDARNAGFDIAKAEWITFIDSDDYVNPKMLEALYNGVIEHGVKVSACGYMQTHGEPLPAVVGLSKLWNAEDFYLQRCINATVAWGKLYHRDVVLPYPLGRLHEDEYVTYRILFAQKKLAVIDAPFYGYYQNAGSIMGSKWNPRRMDLLPAIEQQITFFKKCKYEELYYRHIRMYMSAVLSFLGKIDADENQTVFLKERKHLIAAGRKCLARYHHAFDAQKDGWIIVKFYPGLYQICVYGMAVLRKFGLRKQK